MTFPQKVIDRFWAKVDRRDPDECWPWIGPIRHKGYGGITIDGGCMSAHRVAYIITKGPIPQRTGKDALFVMHSCDNPPCCNPAHLSLGTNRQNMDDARAKGIKGGRKRICTPELAGKVLSMAVEGRLTIEQIAADIGISPATIYRNDPGIRRKAIAAAEGRPP